MIDYNRGCRNAFCLLSSYIDGLGVAEVRRDVYTMPFPGYENVHVSWKMLNAVIDTEEWMTPLKEVKGVYLLTDANTGLTPLSLTNLF